MSKLGVHFHRHSSSANHSNVATNLDNVTAADLEKNGALAYELDYATQIVNSIMAGLA